MGYLEALAAAPDHHEVAMSAAALMDGLHPDEKFHKAWGRLGQGGVELYYFVADLARESEVLYRAIVAAGGETDLAWNYNVDLELGAYFRRKLCGPTEGWTLEILNGILKLEMGSRAIEALTVSDMEDTVSAVIQEAVFKLTGYKP
jgi:hypothetical protein